MVYGFSTFIQSNWKFKCSCGKFQRIHLRTNRLKSTVKFYGLKIVLEFEYLVVDFHSTTKFVHLNKIQKLLPTVTPVHQIQLFCWMFKFQMKAKHVYVFNLCQKRFNINGMPCRLQYLCSVKEQAYIHLWTWAPNWNYATLRNSISTCGRCCCYWELWKIILLLYGWVHVWYNTIYQHAYHFKNFMHLCIPEID